jgi:HSP20 family protein
MARLDRGNHFLSGFGNENFIEEFYMNKGPGLKPVTVLSENENIYKLEIGIPLLYEKDISLQVIGNKLIVSGAKAAVGSPHVRGKKKYEAVFFLPINIKIEEISASFEDGLLVITLPKTKVKQIIQSIMLY